MTEGNYHVNFNFTIIKGILTLQYIPVYGVIMRMEGENFYSNLSICFALWILRRHIFYAICLPTTCLL